MKLVRSLILWPSLLVILYFALEDVIRVWLATPLQRALLFIYLIPGLFLVILAAPWIGLLFRKARERKRQTKMR